MKSKKPLDYKPLGFVTHLKRRIRQNKNNIVVIVGQTGSGKSYSGIRLAELLDPTFSVERCLFKAEDFVGMVENHDLPKGAVILWDEVGLSMDARNFQSIGNKLVAYVLESFRYMNLTLILSVPSLSFCDVKLRKLIHFLVETQRIDHEKRAVACKVLMIQHSARDQRGKVYQKFLRKKGVKLSTTWFHHPSQELADAYEEKKDRFMKQLYREIHLELKAVKRKKSSENFDAHEIVRQIMKRKKDYIKTFASSGRKAINWRKIMVDFNIGRDRAQTVKDMVEQNL